MMTRARDEKELVGLVYSLTERPKEEDLPWYMRPVFLGCTVLILAIALNLVFW